MHTSQTTHHRVYFSNVTNRELLEELTEVLGMEKTEDPDVFDLVQSEGESTVICDALTDTFPERLLRKGCSDVYDMVFDEIVTDFKKLADESNIVPVSQLFEVERYATQNKDVDLDCSELYDLLNVLGVGHYTVDGIYSQWAMTSNKNVFGANAGGTQVTTRLFSVPCQISPDEAETTVRTMSKHDVSNIGDYFVLKFMAHYIDARASEELQESIIAAFRRMMG